MTEHFDRLCLVCPQKPLDWVTIRPSKRYTFFGSLLHCKKCDVTYFKDGLNYLLTDGQVTQNSPLKIPVEPIHDPLEKRTGKLFMINNPEPDWVVITPERVLPTIETLHIQIGSRRINDQSYNFLLDLCRICCCLIGLYERTQLLNISFLGYNNNPRQVWEIPEVADWCHRFWMEYCDIACYMDVKGLYPFAVAVCTAMTNEYIRERVEKNDSSLFSTHKHNPAALRFALLHGFSENILYGRLVVNSKIKPFTHDQYENWIKPFRERIRQLEEPVIREVEKQLKARSSS